VPSQWFLLLRVLAMKLSKPISVGSNSVRSLKKKIWGTNGTLAGTGVSCLKVSGSISCCPSVPELRIDALELTERTELTTIVRQP
jgi:hypothetical protein